MASAVLQDVIAWLSTIVLESRMFVDRTAVSYMLLKRYQAI